MVWNCTGANRTQEPIASTDHDLLRHRVKLTETCVEETNFFLSFTRAEAFMGDGILTRGRFDIDIEMGSLAEIYARLGYALSLNPINPPPKYNSKSTSLITSHQTSSHIYNESIYFDLL